MLRPRVWRKRRGQNQDIVADMKGCRRVLLTAVLVCAAFHACAQDRVSRRRGRRRRHAHCPLWRARELPASQGAAVGHRCAREAAGQQALARLTFQRWARLDCRKTDRYGHSVCNVWVAPDAATNGPKTLDAGLAMVTQGMAWWYRAYAREQTPEERGQYEFAEQEARARRAGLWRDADPTPPWDWRRARP